ncbi:ACHA7-like protein [Mya arenaria]|uniref:ACHA7-like protein n=1 Tax=Mya arenaria TaxID=6604 RepID=A0ABY7DLG4_MYAAR|nr:ACHA7-like protein [Mya arenaria]
MDASYPLWVILSLTTINQFFQYALGQNRTRRESTDEQRLFSALMYNYDHNTRPVYNAAHPVNVSIGITLTQIFDVDERNQVISTNVWLDQALAMVHNNGHVFWPPIVKLRSTCNIDITYFPFDDQICKLKLGSWAYDGFQVDLFSREHPVDLSNFVSNGEWELIHVSAIRNQITYPCCPEHFPDITFHIHIRRRTLYYTYNVIIPCVMLSMLALSGFWMRPDSGEKVTLGLTVLLAFSVFMLLVAENMPATSSFVPLIVILAVLSSNINHRGQKEIAVPRWLISLLCFLSKIMCMDMLFIRPNGRDFSEYRKQSSRSLDQRQHGVNRTYQCMSTALSGDSGCLMDYENGNAHSHNRTTCESQNHISHQPNRQADESKDLTLILERLDDLIAKEDDRERAEVFIKQWVEVAEIIDRFFFWLFVISTLFATLFLIIIYPLFKNPGTIGQMT